MICTNCFSGECSASKTDLTVTVDSVSHTLSDLDCDGCRICGDVTFTHAQSLDVDKKRKAMGLVLRSHVE